MKLMSQNDLVSLARRVNDVQRKASLKQIYFRLLLAVVLSFVNGYGLFYLVAWLTDFFCVDLLPLFIFWGCVINPAAAFFAVFFHYKITIVRR